MTSNGTSVMEQLLSETQRALRTAMLSEQMAWEIEGDFYLTMELAGVRALIAAASDTVESIVERPASEAPQDY
jgi:hypothetical protein